MMTLLLMAILGTALILGMVPVVLFGLMLETCEKRARGDGQVAADPRPFEPARFAVETVRAAA
jgi:hypothetical protein